MLGESDREAALFLPGALSAVNHASVGNPVLPMNSWDFHHALDGSWLQIKWPTCLEAKLTVIVEGISLEAWNPQGMSRESSARKREAGA